MNEDTEKTQSPASEEEPKAVPPQESNPICPKCGMENPKRNSSDEIQCENCGYDEANDADE